MGAGLPWSAAGSLSPSFALCLSSEEASFCPQPGVRRLYHPFYSRCRCSLALEPRRPHRKALPESSSVEGSQG